MTEQERIVITNIVNLLKEQKKTKKELCEYVNVSPTNFGNWLSGRNTGFMKLIYKIAEFFSVSVDYLLGYEKEKIPQDNISEDEKLFLDLFRKLSPEKRQMLIDMLKIALKD